MRAGLNVVALERGDYQDTVPNFAYPKVVDEIAQSARNGLLQNLSKNHRDIAARQIADRRSLSPDRVVQTGEGVGGAGIHWSGVHSRVMPEELNIPKHYGEKYGKKIFSEDMTLQDWGVTYDDLEPHFDRFEYVCGTSSFAQNIQGKITGKGNYFEAPRSRNSATAAERPPDGHDVRQGGG